MVELALASLDTTVDVGFVWFGREELPFGDSALTPLLAREAGLTGADLVVVMEPTANRLQLGCLGNINASWTFTGRAGHSARPWLADNAIHRLAEGVHALAQVPAEVHDFGGLEYREVVSTTTISGGVALNVVPGEAVAQVNYRYPPGCSMAAAEARLHEWCDPYGALQITGHAPSGPVPEGNPLVDALVQLVGPPEPKQAWTPVAEFGAVGVDAVNFGPGEPPLAHTVGESVSIEALVRSYELLAELLCR
jgi:succinyl-diaminopimelate desuccinylase